MSKVKHAYNSAIADGGDATLVQPSNWNADHTVTTAAPGSSAVGDVAAAGSADSLALSDHVHGREAFATPAIVLGTAAAAGAATTHIRSDATIVAFDSTVPVTQAFSDTAATGSAAVSARRDHKHGMPASSSASGGTPALVLGTTNAAGVATTFIREDDTILTFDTTVPVTQGYSDAAGTGSATVAARRDHKHGMPASGASLTSASAQRASDVTMTNANQYYDGPTVSLTAGTWLVVAGLTVVTPSGSGVGVTAKLWDGTTAYASGEFNTAAVGATQVDTITLAYTVAPGSTTTYKISAASTVTGCINKAAAPDNAAGNTASFITAVKIA